MSVPRRRPGWLLRNGVWIRRSLIAIVLGMIIVGKAAGVPDHSPTARIGFFLALGPGGGGLFLDAVESLQAVRHRGYWFDHDSD